MSFPNLITTCASCGNSNCTCESNRSQYTIPTNKLPLPTTPGTFDDVPQDVYGSDAIIWSGADYPNLGIKNGDTLTKIINIILSKLV